MVREELEVILKSDDKIIETPGYKSYERFNDVQKQLENVIGEKSRPSYNLMSTGEMMNYRS